MQIVVIVSACDEEELGKCLCCESGRLFEEAKSEETIIEVQDDLATERLILRK